jgi:F-type H+-transporting ATPase subunit b
LITINFTLLVQLANFLILLVVLNFLLFKPILRVLDERERLVQESTEIKERLTSLADEGVAKYEKQLMDAKQQAMGIRTGVRSDVMSEFRKQVLDAKEASMQELEIARQQITAEAESTRKVLLGEAEALAGEIAGKLVGRSL